MAVCVGNRLTGKLPHAIRERWEAGPLRLIGYASQFTAEVQEIVIRRRAAILCYDSEATIKADGAVLIRAEKCRAAPRGQQPQVYCEIKAGRADVFSQDVDRLVLFLETSGFFWIRARICAAHDARRHDRD